MLKRAGFGGGCHWCTEAVFSSLKGISSVEQGWIVSNGENSSFSEAVIVEFDPEIISFEILTAVHLHTHSSTAAHSMREKYRSAIYFFDENDVPLMEEAILKSQDDFGSKIITKILPFVSFKINREDALNYYFSNPDKPFCENYISPKLKLILKQFTEFADVGKLQHIK